METKKIDSVVEYLQNLKIMRSKMFSDDELDFLLENSKCTIYEFTQEIKNETDADFYHNFVAWLNESEIKGYVYYYIIAGMRKNETLSDEEFEYFERNVTSCFETGYGWITQTNHELRFKRRLKLIMFERIYPFYKLIKRK